MIKREGKLQFWELNDKGRPRILNAKLMGFLESRGFANARITNNENILVQMRNNRMSLASEAQVDQIIQNYLIANNELEIYEIYVRGMGSYVSARKFNLLKPIELVNDRDASDNSKFFYSNCFCEITKKGVFVKPYENLQLPIWENRILCKSYERPSDGEKGQFEKFCANITGNMEDRLLGLKTILGYLLHRNKEVGEPKAIILYDERMGENNQAHGGTGKTLLSQAIAKCREVEFFDGKEIKAGSWFKNQRIELTTDVLVYDDLNKNVSLENFYTIITSGIEVEKKRKQAFFIDFMDSPKILITSNYPVKGPGGSSDIRRRHEFELSNYYNADFTPEIEFGNRFFGNSWEQEEWNKFFHFMMSCVQEYLRYGIVEVVPINLNTAKLVNKSCQEFIDFADKFVEFNTWQDKREFEVKFKELHPTIDVSPHTIKKWLTAYAMDRMGTYKDKSSGGKYFFKIGREVKDV